MEIAAGEYGYELVYFRRMLEAGAVDILQADATRCAASPASSRPRRSARRARSPLSAHCAPSLSRARRAAPRRGSATSNISTTTSASSGCSSTACSSPVDGALRARPLAPGPRPRAQARRRGALRGREHDGRPPRTAPTPSRRRRARRHRERGRRPAVLDAGALEADLRAIAARSASTTATARSTRPTPRTTGRSRSASSSRGRSTTWSRRSPVCRDHGAPILSRGGGHEPRRADCCNVAVVIDFSKYLNRIARDRPERQAGARAAGRASSTTCATQAERVRPDLRPGPLHARPLHARRDDRQQLLRRPFGHGPVLRDRAAHGRQGRGAGISPTTACACGRRDDRGGARADHRGGRPPRRDLRRAARPARPLRATRSASASRTSRAGSPATTSTSCCPRTASTSPARWSAPRAPASPSSRRGRAWSTARRAARCSSSATPTSSARGDHVPRS